MSILKVVKYGDPVLRKPTEEVHKVSAKIQKLVDDMFDTMYAENGVGLAAPQVAVSKRIFVLDCSSKENPLPAMVFINPTIIKKSGAYLSHEGCLSFPGLWTEVKRYREITVKAKDAKGRPFVMTPDPGSLLAVAIQHELDHLNGILFIDHVIDRFGTDKLLKEANLPPIDPDKLLDEPELARLIEIAQRQAAEKEATQEEVHEA